MAPKAFADDMKKDTMSKDSMSKDSMKKRHHVEGFHIQGRDVQGVDVQGWHEGRYEEELTPSPASSPSRLAQLTVVQ
jgi:hypothetical protein